jgi:hypothetical protein
LCRFAKKKKKRGQARSVGHAPLHLSNRVTVETFHLFRWESHGNNTGCDVCGEKNGRERMEVSSVPATARQRERKRTTATCPFASLRLVRHVHVKSKSNPSSRNRILLRETFSRRKEAMVINKIRERGNSSLAFSFSTPLRSSSFLLLYFCRCINDPKIEWPPFPHCRPF